MTQFYRITNRIALFLTLFFCSAHAFAGYTYEDELTLKMQRKLYLQAEKALDANEMETYKALSSGLKNYPLYTLLEQKQVLKSDLSNKATVDKLLSRYTKTSLETQIRARWLDFLASQQDWSTYLKYYQAGLGEKRYCQYLNAKWDASLQNAKALKSIAHEVTGYWTHGSSRDKSCDAVFSKWQKAGYQTTSVTWNRAAKAIAAREYNLVDYLKKSLSSTNQLELDVWKSLRDDPSKLETYLKLPTKGGHSAHIIINSLYKLAWKTPSLAVRYVETLKPKFGLSDDTIAELNKTIALAMAVDNDPSAEQWISQIPVAQQNDQLKEWRVRAALRQQNWPNVEAFINNQSATALQESTWQYWLGIAEINNGKKTEGTERLKKIASQRHYYGFLAAQYLGLKPSLNNKELKLDEAKLKSIAYLPEVRRSYELLQLERIPQARREWQQAVIKTKSADRKYLASLAHAWEWHDRAINTLAQSKNLNALKLRFPTAYKETVLKYSQLNNLDTDWVYAVIRQESAFIHDVKSPVGAMGLMQLMPDTAKSLVKLLDQKWEGLLPILTPERNIELGTRYLTDLNSQFIHFTMATAAYNAGPHRVVKWMPADKNLPLTIWIETIPFKETRGYVKNIVAYRVIYSEFLGNSLSFLDQLSKTTIFELEQIKNAAPVADNAQSHL